MLFGLDGEEVSYSFPYYNPPHFHVKFPCSMFSFYREQTFSFHCKIVYLLGIRIPEVHELKGIPDRESKGMHRRHIFSLFDFG